jgi:hypothetical protein
VTPTQDRECARCPAFIWAPESLRTGLCFGCRAGGPTETITTPPTHVSLTSRKHC